jgi:indole-3-glycerol phosphate synthase
MLDQILETKRCEVERLYELYREADGSLHMDLHVQERMIPHLSFIQSLSEPNRGQGIIAEVKKASPSKGVIRADFEPVSIARSYAEGGADCLSVLTDTPYFQGDKTYIARIKEHVRLPVLRKDFIIDPLQVQESVELGADAILLIAKALSDQQLKVLYEQAHGCGLDCLIEVSNLEELETVFSTVQPRMIGVNNRDLSTFVTDPARTVELLPHIPDDVLVVSESGIHDAATVRRLAEAGVSAFLVGEHFMRQDDPGAAIGQLLGPTAKSEKSVKTESVKAGNPT